MITEFEMILKVNFGNNKSSIIIGDYPIGTDMKVAMNGICYNSLKKLYPDMNGFRLERKTK